MYEELQPIKWFEQNFVADFQMKVVKINGILCKIFTLGDLQPGTFGVKMKLGETAKVLAKNNLPYKDCKCDVGTTESKMSPSSDVGSMGSMGSMGNVGSMVEMPENPCWINLHFHGFWGPALQDEVYACVKPGQQKQYCYTISDCHPRGLFIIHTHNFSASLYQDTITTFPVLVHSKEDDDKLDCKPKHEENVVDLTIAVAYMQKAESVDGVVPLDYELETFNFPKYLHADNFAELMKAAPKFVLTNGQINPKKNFPVGEKITLRVAFTGIGDILSLALLDDRNERQKFTITSFDTLPVPAGGSRGVDSYRVHICPHATIRYFLRFGAAGAVSPRQVCHSGTICISLFRRTS